MNKGRKHEALLFAIALLIMVFAGMMYLSIKEIEIPRAFETVLVILATVLPAYIGANVTQKKIQNGGKHE